MATGLSKFGEIDLEVESERSLEPKTDPRRTQSFGEIDLASIGELGDRATPEPEPAKPAKPKYERPISAAHRELQRRATREMEAVKPPVAADETRIAKAGALAEAISMSKVDTRHVRKLDTGPDSSRSGRTSPSASGVAQKEDNRVAAMRELYANGEAEAALELASKLTEPPHEEADDVAPPVDLAVDDAFSGFDDGYGGLEPVEDDDHEHPSGADEDAADRTMISISGGDAGVNSSRLATLTSRKTPRLLCSLNEIAKLPMDPRAAFILGHVDGQQSMEEILDVCAMPESEALELLERLRIMNVIAID